MNHSLKKQIYTIRKILQYVRPVGLSVGLLILPFVHRVLASDCAIVSRTEEELQRIAAENSINNLYKVMILCVAGFVFALNIYVSHFRNRQAVFTVLVSSLLTPLFFVYSLGEGMASGCGGGGMAWSSYQFPIGLFIFTLLLQLLFGKKGTNDPINLNLK